MDEITVIVNFDNEGIPHSLSIRQNGRRVFPERDPELAKALRQVGFILVRDEWVEMAEEAARKAQEAARDE